MATTATSSPTKLLLAAALALGLSSTACGPITPVTPTWKNDVRPLVISRCLRCHDGSGKGDPAVTNSAAFSMAVNLDHDDYLPSSPPEGLKTLRMYLAPTMNPPPVLNAVRGIGVSRRMPPPPLEALEDWQIEIFEAWAVNPR